MKAVTILGGTGIFGGRIAAGLAESPEIQVTIASRSPDRAASFADRIGARCVTCDATSLESVETILEETDLLIHTAGPFQGDDYRVAEACIRGGVHYLDISDGRDFVCGITLLDAAAKEGGVVIGSGASSVPTITHAMIGELATDFSSIETIQIALSPGNRNPRGSSTIGAILSYVGRPIRVWERGQWNSVLGWSDCQVLDFPAKVGRRRVYRCETPELELFPSLWKAGTVRFHAGVELNLINHTLDVMGRLRKRIPLPWLPRLAGVMTQLSRLVFSWGSKNGALSVWVNGIGPAGTRIERRLAIVTDDDGPATPSSPGILLGRKILLEDSLPPGAYPCCGHLEFSEIMRHLEPFGIWHASGDESGWAAG
ncbi:MAG: saccharopine dehydrogenase NADP-binding domain-containing protein [Pirellulales bacterium]